MKRDEADGPDGGPPPHDDASATASAAASGTASTAPIDATRTSAPGASAALVAASAPPPPLLGQLRGLERYEILGEHGRGGLGRITRARDRELERDVAIKELLHRNHISELRFFREALITARLEHPGIVPVHEAGRWPDGTPFYAMKLVAGRPLRDLIAERHTVDERLGLLHHVIAVADAIAYAHDHHIIHRDLKPGNVIVGDFGETVVIDWGLAKDLTTSEDQSLPPSPSPSSAPPPHHDDLTNTGSVLGTPAYMAPEQERGEHVDQRADVFAIGAMLWELCALQKVPPRESRDRLRTLRHAGIDRDLITIIDKAVASDPVHRYANAGALAADLKAFKAGTRIAARTYSLPALLAHWTRRHRALAYAIVALSVLAILATATYIKQIDAALVRTEAAKDELTIEHAELLLRSDPSAALAALASYRGPDDLRRQRLVAEAKGLGVAQQTLAPHSDTIAFMIGKANGEILSLGEDGRVQRTLGGASTTVASDVALDVHVAYAPASDVLAYATSPGDLALLRLRDQARSTISNVHARALQFSTNGARLAAITEAGDVVVWSTEALDARELYRAAMPSAASLMFATPSRLVIQDGAGVRAIALDASGGAPSLAALAQPTALDARPDLVAVGTRDGNLHLLSASLQPIATTSLCHGTLNAVQLIPGHDQLVYACSDDNSGILRFTPAGALVLDDSFPTRGVTDATADASGRFVMLIDDSRTGYVYDLATRLIHRYDGHVGHLSFIAPPTAGFPHVMTGDVDGTIRVWDDVASHARVALQAPMPLYSVVLAADRKLLLANGYETAAHGVDLETGARFELPGDDVVSSEQVAPDGSSMLTYGAGHSVRVWRTRDRKLIRVFDGHTNTVGEVNYLDANHIVSAGSDGQLLAWMPDGNGSTVLLKVGTPLRKLEVLTGNHHIVVHDSHGAVWDVAPDRAVRQVRTADEAAITSLRASRDGAWLAVGTATGRVEVYDTATWQRHQTFDAEGGIRALVFDPQDRDLAIASDARGNRAGHVHLLALTAKRTYHWNDVATPVRDIAYSADGNTMGFVCGDGSTWLYSMTADTWVYANDKRTETTTAVFSTDDRWFVSGDRHGAVILRDVSASFAAAKR